MELADGLLSYVSADTEGRAEVATLLAAGQLHAPLFTLRGGTNEVLVRDGGPRDVGLR